RPDALSSRPASDEEKATRCASTPRPKPQRACEVRLRRGSHSSRPAPCETGGWVHLWLLGLRVLRTAEARRAKAHGKTRTPDVAARSHHQASEGTDAVGGG